MVRVIAGKGFVILYYTGTGNTRRASTVLFYTDAGYTRKVSEFCITQVREILEELPQFCFTRMRDIVEKFHNFALHGCGIYSRNPDLVLVRSLKSIQENFSKNCHLVWVK